jgi:RNA polymerase sigma factor (sigma-70 family)
MDAHRRQVWRFLRAVLPSYDAEDCFQETFLAALRAYPELRNGSNLKSWVMTIAHRKAVDVHRGKKKVRPTDKIPDRADPQTKEDDPELWDAVRALPDKQREAVAHRFVSDLTYRDIALVMESSEAAARKNVSEGVRKLREVLKK